MTQASTQRVLRPGVVIADKYRIDKPIARGGFSVIYRGTHIDMERSVALKLLALDDEIKPSWLERFTREARLASQLTHSNTVTIFDYGQDPRGFLYIVMEWVEGKSLYHHLKEYGALPPREVAEISVQILDSLDEAHRRGFLHRDLKPSNIMLGRDYEGRETIKVLDFGIAKNLEESGRDDVQITHQGAFVGTPRYASPEQLDGKELTPAADIYSLGLLMWEALVGDPAVSSVRYGDCVEQHLGEEPWRLPHSVQCPPGLAKLLYRALEKSVDDRYRSCRQMRRDVSAWLDSKEARDLDEESFFVSGSSGGFDLRGLREESEGEGDALFAGIGEDSGSEEEVPLDLHGPSGRSGASSKAKPVIDEVEDDFERELMALAESSWQQSTDEAPEREESGPPSEGPSAPERARRIPEPGGPDRSRSPSGGFGGDDQRKVALALSAFAVLLMLLAGFYVVVSSGGEEVEPADEAHVSAEQPAAEQPEPSPQPESTEPADDGTPTYSADTILMAVRRSGWTPIGRTDEVDLHGVAQTSGRFRKKGKTVTLTIYENSTHEDAASFEKTVKEPAQAVRFGTTVVQVAPGARGNSTHGVYALMSTMFELKSIAREQAEKEHDD